MELNQNHQLFNSWIILFRNTVHITFLHMHFDEPVDAFWWKQIETDLLCEAINDAQRSHSNHLPPLSGALDPLLIRTTHTNWFPNKLWCRATLRYCQYIYQVCCLWSPHCSGYPCDLTWSGQITHIFVFLCIYVTANKHTCIFTHLSPTETLFWAGLLAHFITRAEIIIQPQQEEPTTNGRAKKALRLTESSPQDAD